MWMVSFHKTSKTSNKPSSYIIFVFGQTKLMCRHLVFFTFPGLSVIQRCNPDATLLAHENTMRRIGKGCDCNILHF